jgi:hypothetical protein
MCTRARAAGVAQVAALWLLYSQELMIPKCRKGKPQSVPHIDIVI